MFKLMDKKIIMLLTLKVFANRDMCCFINFKLNDYLCKIPYQQ